jgi:glutathione synthase/RimK-type ligase-like ATP-grasp enzyme
MRAGIIGPPGDPQVDRVGRRLRELAATPAILDLSRFPGQAPASVIDGVPVCPGVDLTAIDAWYVRSSPLPLPFQPLRVGPGGIADVRATKRAFAAGREERSFMTSFVRAIARLGATLVNPPDVATQHFLKLDQLELLRAAGVPVPRTLASNDPQAVVEFARGLDGPMVYKPLAGGGMCRRATQTDLRMPRLRALAAAPVLFQEEVAGANIRVYLVDGDAVASYEIVSEQLDYRGAETAVHVTALTDAERTSCVAAAAACGMLFTGIDLRRRPDGSHALLECNPSPMFAAIEQHSGTSAVTDALAAMLLSARRAPRR